MSVNINEIKGGLGTLYMNKPNGERRRFSGVKKLNAVGKKSKSTIQTIEDIVDRHTTSRISYTGNCTLYQLDSEMLEEFLELQNTGIDVYFDLVVENYAGNDGKRSEDSQIVNLIECNFDETSICDLDASNPPKEVSTGFTFHGFELVKKFKKSTTN